jgi:hypothetical protein
MNEYISSANECISLLIPILALSIVPIIIFSMCAAYGWHCYKEERDYKAWAELN